MQRDGRGMARPRRLRPVSAAAGIALTGLVGARNPAPTPRSWTTPAWPAGPVACVTTATRPALYSIPLIADQGMSGSGVATLIPAPSPFGITLTADGHPVFAVTVSVQNLPAVSALGGTEYVAWATTQDLTDANKLGVIGADQKTTGTVAWNKYIVLVTAEHAPVGTHWKGPVVLRGFSPSTYLANYASHPLFLGGMPPC